MSRETLLSDLRIDELLYLEQSAKSCSDEEQMANLQAVTGTLEIPSSNKPHPRQAEFLNLDCEEALYGGSLGSGKTEALMMWLAEGVNYPGFSGLFLRRTYAQLAGSPTTPIERAFRFFIPMGGRYHSGKKVWNFPNGAMIRFGHMQYEGDKHNYDGPEFHRIAFDQVEQFTDTQYQWMFGRLRRNVDFDLPCGVRAAANPIGYPWVKTRFITPEAIEQMKGFTAYDPTPAGLIFTAPNGAKFVPARIADNPTLQVGEYIERLQSKLGPVLAARLANGDWSIVEGAQIDPALFRYYQTRGEMVIPLTAAGDQLAGLVVDSRRLTRFAVVDTAGTSKQKAEAKKGKEPSHSTCGVFDYYPQLKSLFVRHVWRELVDFEGLELGVAGVIRRFKPNTVVIEKAHFGEPLASNLKARSLGANYRLVNPVIRGMKSAKAGPGESAKLERAVASGMFKAFRRGLLYFPDIGNVPEAAQWLPDYESELLRWTGDPADQADQVDITSYALDHIRKQAASWGGVIPN